MTYQTIHKRRGKEGIDGNGIISEFNGTAVHDCWSSYWKYDDIQHAICGAHLLRELNGIEENNPEHKWAPDFKKLLLMMKKAKDKALDKGKKALSYYHLHKFEREYQRIMDLADIECPLPQSTPIKKRGRIKKGKERCLIDRLIALKREVCLFVHDFQVPFDNNQAERDLRNLKTKNKVSGCFRAEHGAQNYLDIMSYHSTGQKHGINVVDALSHAFNGNGNFIIQPGF